MPFRVTLSPSGHAFEVPEGKTVLVAGLAAGRLLPYSCRAGICRTCRGRVLEGEVDYGDARLHFLPADQRAAGFALLCQARPRSDLLVAVDELSPLDSKPRIVPCRVRRIDRPAPDVAVIHLKLPLHENLQFMPGQYVDLLLEGGERRSYSIANPPTAEGVLEIQIHVRHSPGGLFTNQVFSTLREREMLRIEAPLGTFFLRAESSKPVLLVASGTGFGPMKAILEHAFRERVDERRSMTLYWGCRARRDLYMLDLPERWARERPPFRFVPILSEPLPADNWSGRTGLVHRAVMEDFPDLSGHQVYACGVPVMVDAARADFVACCRLPANEFLADAFVTELERNAASQEAVSP
jgi:CDP-4-dehydro-6-deoxyglucose reductase